MKKLVSILLTLAVAVSLCLVTATPVAAAELKVGSGETYTTIQDAVDAASPNDTINVAAGTYPENVFILPDKDGLQLIGAGSGETFITGDKPVLLRGWQLANDPPLDGFRIQGFTLVVTTGASHAFLAGSGTPNDSAYTTNLELEDIVVNGGQRGIGLNAVVGVTFTDVHISNISGSLEGALELTGVSNLTFTDGSIEGNTIGVRLQPTGDGQVGDGYGLNDNIQIHNSNLIGNTSFAVENQDSGTTINATNNWWGAIDGPSHSPGSGDKVSGYVDYEPWLDAPWTNTVVNVAAETPEIIAINVAPTSIDFGTLYPGESSSATTLTISNMGTVDVRVDTSIENEVGTFFTDNLWLGTKKAINYSINSLAVGGSPATPGAQVVVPPTYPAVGAATGTLLFTASPA